MGNPQFVLRVEVREVDRTGGGAHVSYVHFRTPESERMFRDKLYKLMQDSSDALLIAADDT